MSLRTAIETLVVANRILAQKGVLDSFGHVSARHPENPGRYLMSRARSARVVAEPEERRDPLVAGRARQLQQRSLLNNPAVAQPRDPFGERPRFVVIVRDDKRRKARGA